MASVQRIWTRIRGKNYLVQGEKDLRQRIAGGQIPFSSWIHREDKWKLLAEVPDLRQWHPEFEPMPRGAPSEGAADAGGELPQGSQADLKIKRRFDRAAYGVEVIAHDNARVIEGRAMVIGEGGLFLALSGGARGRSLRSVGSRLKLHFREGKTPSFNALAEIVAVVRGKNPGYCLKFVSIAEADRRKIARLVREEVKVK